MDNPEILVVDDDPIVRRIVQAYLAEAGYSVAVAKDGEAARNHIASQPPDLVVTDWNMPGFTGIDLTQSIRADSDGRIYILLITARSSDEDAVAAVEAGADDFLSKPIIQQELLARVQRGFATLRRIESDETLATTDALTGAYNRRVFFRDCTQLIERSRSTGESLACLLLDLDYFKHINDTHGHSAGDQALLETVKSVRSQLRQGDNLYRYGGDEFCVLLPHVDEDVALRRARAIHTAVADIKLDVGNTLVPLRCSVGVSFLREDINVPEQLVDLADEALRLAKQSGRNQVQRLNSQESLDLQRLVTEHDDLRTLRADQLMLSPPITLDCEMSMCVAADHMLRLQVDSLPVVDKQGDLVGVLSEQDLFQQVPGVLPWSGPIESVMQTNYVCFDAQTRLQQIWEFFRRIALRRVVIVEGKRAVGTISRASLLRWATIRCHSGSHGGAVNHQGLLVHRVSELAAGVEAEMNALRDSMAKDPLESEMALVCAAGRLQERADQLLAQTRYADNGLKGREPSDPFAVEFHH